MKIKRVIILLIVFPLLYTITHCEGGGSDQQPGLILGKGEGIYSVGGGVSGLLGSLIIQNNGGDDLTITNDGPFAFKTKLNEEEKYNITILTPPSEQVCSVADGVGNVKTSDITNVTIACSRTSFIVKGKVSGLLGTLILQINSGNDLTLNQNGDFTFDNVRLADSAKYDVTVTKSPQFQNCTTSKGQGVISGADITDVEVKCGNMVWNSPEKYSQNISQSLTSVKNPMVDMDKSDNVIIVWEGIDVNFNVDNIFTSSYDSSSKQWGSSASFKPGNLAKQQMAFSMHSSGHAMLGWVQTEANNNNAIYVSLYDPKTKSWSATKRINVLELQNTVAGVLRVKINGKGDAIAIWEQTVPAKNADHIFVNQYFAASGQWLVNPIRLSLLDTAAKTSSSSITLDDSGNAVAVWIQEKDYIDNIEQLYMAIYAANAQVWVFPAGIGGYVSFYKNIEEDDPLVDNAQVAMGENGKAVIVWRQEDDSQPKAVKRLFLVEYDFNTATLKKPANIGDSFSLVGEKPFFPKLVMNGKGTALVVWEQKDNSSQVNRIYKAEYNSNTGQLIKPTNFDDSLSPNMTNAIGEPTSAINGNGDIVVVWMQEKQLLSQERFLISAGYDAKRDKWFIPTDTSVSISLDLPDMSEPQSPKVAINDSINSIVVWLQRIANNPDQLFKAQIK
ncbi:MAG: hypothetical protein ABIE74_13165 [Pseudomonadota bacterium]